MKDKFKKLRELLGKIKVEYLVVAALAIVAMVIALNAFPKNEQTSKSDDISDYVSDLETKLEKCLKNVKGAGSVSVIISVASGVEQVFATEKITDSNGKTTELPVTVGGKTVVLKERFPEIVGVVVVCDGADKLSVIMDVVNACKVFLSVDESKIKVLSR